MKLMIINDLVFRNLLLSEFTVEVLCLEQRIAMDFEIENHKDQFISGNSLPNLIEKKAIVNLYRIRSDIKDEVRS